MAATRSGSDRLRLAPRLAILIAGLVTLVAVVLAKSPTESPPCARSPLLGRRFCTVFATVRPVTDYSVVVRNPNSGSASRILVRVRAQSGNTFTRVLSGGETVASETLLPGNGTAQDRAISDVAVMEQELPRSEVEWWVRP